MAFEISVDWMGALDVWICMDLHHLRVPGGCGNCRGCGCILGSGFRSKLWSFKEKVRDSFRSYLHHRRTGRCRCFDLELSPILFHLWPVQAICGLEDCHQFGWTRRMWRQDVTMDNTGWGTQRCTWPACWFTSHPCRWGPWVQEELIFRIFVGNKMKHENMKRTKGKTWKITKDHEIVHKSLPGLSGLSSLKKSENSCFFWKQECFCFETEHFLCFFVRGSGTALQDKLQPWKTSQEKTRESHKRVTRKHQERHTKTPKPWSHRPSLTVRPDPGLKSQPLRWNLSGCMEHDEKFAMKTLLAFELFASCSNPKPQCWGVFVPPMCWGVVLDSRGRVREGPLMDTKMAPTLIFTSLGLSCVQRLTRKQMAPCFAYWSTSLEAKIAVKMRNRGTEKNCWPCHTVTITMQRRHDFLGNLSAVLTCPN